MRMRHQAQRDRIVKKFRPMDLYIKAFCIEIPSVEIWIQKQCKKVKYEFNFLEYLFGCNEESTC